MSDLSIIAPILTALVALAGSLVAGLSVYFTYKGRHNLLRQAVYGRQMDAYFDITESMTALYTAAQNALALCHPRLKGEEARTQLRTALREQHERFTGIVNRSLIVLPSKVKAALDYFNEVLLTLCALPEELPAGLPGEVAGLAPDSGRGLAGAYGRAVNTIRHHLAVDSLTTGMLKEMGLGSESVMLKGLRSGINPLVSVGRRVP